MRKVYVNITTRVVIEIEEGTSLDSVISELDYDFQYDLDECATVIDTEIIDYQIIDSK